MSLALEVVNLKKSYSTFKLKNINFSLQKGCVTGFIGINGSGKTTTIKSILGLTTIDSGCIKFFNLDFHENEREIKNRIGVVLDDGYFYDKLNLKEMKNIIAPAYTNWDESTFQNNIKKFNLNPNQKISTLSKGMRMKYSISLALSHHADLLIMDEPTSGLDPLVRSELMDILLKFMKKEGKSVFFSTHITSDLDKVADNLILINNGQIILSESKNILLESHFLVRGNTDLITEDIKKSFLSLNVTKNNFEGITTQRNVLNHQLNNLIVEKPTIEEIMLAYVGGGKNEG